MGCVSIHTLALIALMLHASSNHEVVGKWKTLEDTNGFHFIFEFADDGSFSQTMRMEGSGTYKVRRDRIHFNSVRMGRDINKFRIEGDTLFLQTPKREQRLTRAGKATTNAPPIVGKWEEEGIFEDGQKYSMTMVFTKSGRSVTEFDIKLKGGTYKINGDLLTMTNEDNETLINGFRFERGLLIFKEEREGGSEQKYRRIGQPNKTS